MTKQVLAATLVLTALSLAACGSGTDAGYKPGGFLGGIGIFPKGVPQIAPKYEEPTIKNLMGTPQPFPAEYPLAQYPNARVLLAEVRPVYTARRPNMVCLQSSDDIGKIANYYRLKLSSEGWKFKSADENPVFSSTIWEKGDQVAEVRISPSPQEGQKIIQLFIAPAGKS